MLSQDPARLGRAYLICASIHTRGETLISPVSRRQSLMGARRELVRRR